MALGLASPLARRGADFADEYDLRWGVWSGNERRGRVSVWTLDSAEATERVHRRRARVDASRLQKHTLLYLS